MKITPRLRVQIDRVGDLYFHPERRKKEIDRLRVEERRRKSDGNDEKRYLPVSGI